FQVYPGKHMRGSLLPPWVDRLRPLLAVALVLGPLYLVGLAYLTGSPNTTDVGYKPQQPVPFSHALHAGEMGLDCRYCHTTVEKAARAALPSTDICMNCHTQVATGSDKTRLIRESASSGLPIPWVRVHDLPDFAYFDHSAHVTRGVGCVSCHGRVDLMEEVTQVQTLSMGWCLDCHRNPEPHLVPRENVTDLDWAQQTDPQTRAKLAAHLKEVNNIHPSTDCSTCHR
ncbi:MAG: cytochrome c3 family protein, partial [Thermoguttaceae bacterium]